MDIASPLLEDESNPLLPGSALRGVMRQRRCSSRSSAVGKSHDAVITAAMYPAGRFIAVRLIETRCDDDVCPVRGRRIARCHLHGGRHNIVAAYTVIRSAMMDFNSASSRASASCSPWVVIIFTFRCWFPGCRFVLDRKKYRQ